MLWLYIIGGVVVGLPALLWLVGGFLSPHHVASRSLKVTQSPDEVWAIVSDFTGAAKWWPRLQESERLPDRNGHEAYREKFGRGEVFELEVTERVPGQRLVRTITDVNRLFSGRWEWDFASAGSGSRITLTEHGTISKRIIRCLARMTMNRAMYIEDYLKALAARLGQPAELESPVAR